MANLVGQEPWELRGTAQTLLSQLERRIAPVGSLCYFARGIPEGSLYLACDGGTFDGGMYPDLAVYLGGTTLPNYKGCVLVMQDAAQAEFDTLGEAGGAKTVTLTEAQMPPHAHTDEGHTHFHFHDITIGGSGVHDHVPDFVGAGDFAVRNSGAANGLVGSPAEKVTFTGVTGDGGHSHTGASLDDATIGAADLEDAGGGQAHSNLQPYKVAIIGIKAA